MSKFITMTKLGKNGRLGNQMFQYSIMKILSIFMEMI